MASYREKVIVPGRVYTLNMGKLQTLRPVQTSSLGSTMDNTVASGYSWFDTKNTNVAIYGDRMWVIDQSTPYSQTKTIQVRTEPVYTLSFRGLS